MPVSRVRRLRLKWCERRPLFLIDRIWVSLGLLASACVRLRPPRLVPPRLRAMRGKVSYRCSTAKGLSTKFLSVFDLELPADFKPYNGDGEVNIIPRLRYIAAERNQPHWLLCPVPDEGSALSAQGRCPEFASWVLAVYGLCRKPRVVNLCLGIRLCVVSGVVRVAEHVVVLVPPAVDGFMSLSFSNPFNSSDSTREVQHL